MMPLLVETLPSTQSSAIRRTRRERWYWARKRTMGVRRSTVSRLWPKMWGRAAISVRMEEGFSFKSEASTSMMVEGLAFLTARITWAKWAAAPSGRSSRVTMVMTAWRSFMCTTASATCCGSSGSSGKGLAVFTAQ